MIRGKENTVWFGWLACVVALAGCGEESSGPATGIMVQGGAGGVVAGAGGAVAGVGGAVAGAGGAVAGAGGAVAGAGGAGGGTAGGPPVMMCGGGAAKEGQCKDKAEGIYAMKVEIDAYWEGELAENDRGTITIYLKGELTDICEDGSGGTGEIVGCGVDLPPFVADESCDAYQIQFPDDMWDKPTMPKFYTTGSTTGFDPGDILTFVQTSGLLGIELAGVDDAWPTPDQTTSFTCPSGSGEQCFPDHDGDGKPGITINMKADESEYAYPDACNGGMPFKFRGSPTTVDLAAGGGAGGGIRATSIQIGTRVGMGGGGAINADCASGVGESTANGLVSRVWSCQTNMGGECTGGEASFVDNNTPKYTVLSKGQAPPALPRPLFWSPLDTTPSKGAMSAIVRVGEVGQDIPCATIRAANFPAIP